MLKSVFGADAGDCMVPSTVCRAAADLPERVRGRGCLLRQPQQMPQVCCCTLYMVLRCTEAVLTAFAGWWLSVALGEAAPLQMPRGAAKE